MVADKIVRRKW